MQRVRRRPSATTEQSKIKKARLGSIDDAERGNFLLDGFPDLKSLYAWPTYGFEVLFQDERRLNDFKLLMDSDWDCFSYYSGKATETTIIEYFNRLLASQNIVSKDRTPFHNVHASDQDKSCIDAMLGMRNGDRVLLQHVFGSTMSRYDYKMLQTLSAMKTAAGNDRNSQVLAYQEMQKYAMTCVRDEVLFKPSGEDYCYQCKAFHSVFPSLPPKHIRFVCAGSCCENFSLYGDRSGLGGVSYI